MYTSTLPKTKSRSLQTKLGVLRLVFKNAVWLEICTFCYCNYDCPVNVCDLITENICGERAQDKTGHCMRLAHTHTHTLKYASSRCNIHVSKISYDLDKLYTKICIYRVWNESQDITGRGEFHIPYSGKISLG